MPIAASIYACLSIVSAFSQHHYPRKWTMSICYLHVIDHLIENVLNIGLILHIYIWNFELVCRHFELLCWNVTLDKSKFRVTRLKCRVRMSKFRVSYVEISSYYFLREALIRFRCFVYVCIRHAVAVRRGLKMFLFFHLQVQATIKLYGNFICLQVQYSK